jgi:hypothetical protein
MKPNPGGIPNAGILATKRLKMRKKTQSKYRLIDGKALPKFPNFASSRRRIYPSRSTSGQTP